MESKFHDKHSSIAAQTHVSCRHLGSERQRADLEVVLAAEACAAPLFITSMPLDLAESTIRLDLNNHANLCIVSFSQLLVFWNNIRTVSSSTGQTTIEKSKISASLLHSCASKSMLLSNE